MQNREEELKNGLLKLWNMFFKKDTPPVVNFLNVAHHIEKDLGYSPYINVPYELNGKKYKMRFDISIEEIKYNVKKTKNRLGIPPIRR